MEVVVRLDSGVALCIDCPNRFEWLSGKLNQKLKNSQTKNSSFGIQRQLLGVLVVVAVW